MPQLARVAVLIVVAAAWASVATAAVAQRSSGLRPRPTPCLRHIRRWEPARRRAHRPRCLHRVRLPIAHMATRGQRSAATASGLAAVAAGPYAMALSWPAARGAVAYEIRLDDALVDRIAAAPAPAYTVRELWPGSRFIFAVRALGPTGATLATISASAATPAAAGPFPRLYGAGAFVNTPIAHARLDPATAAMVATSILPFVPSANLSNDDAWGIPVVSADPSSGRYGIGCRLYWCQTDVGPQAIPAGATASTGGDGHLAVLEPGGAELDMWLAERAPGGWSAGERSAEPAGGPAVNCAAGGGCGAADAAGFALAAGIVRPEEIAQGHIDHALLLATPATRRGYVACPAVSGDGHEDDPTALPLGAHVQLDPRVDVAALPLPAWQKVIAVALQRYGAYVGDTGGSLEIRAESNLGRSYDAWARAGVPANAPSLADLPWSSVHVLSMTRCA